MVRTKSVLSLLFIFTALIRPHPVSGYYGMVLTALVFCFLGDIFLALPQERMFLVGLISFLLGHVFYSLGFFRFAAISHYTLFGTIGTLIISVSIYIWLKPQLGSMKIPVLFYVVIITIMVSTAWSVFGNDQDLSNSGRFMVLAGALGFYFSDIFVARDRFINNGFINRLVGLPMYYSGQFLLAFSIGSLNLY